MGLVGAVQPTDGQGGMGIVLDVSCIRALAGVCFRVVVVPIWPFQHHPYQDAGRLQGTGARYLWSGGLGGRGGRPRGKAVGRWVRRWRWSRICMAACRATRGRAPLAPGLVGCVVFTCSHVSFGIAQVFRLRLGLTHGRRGKRSRVCRCKLQKVRVTRDVPPAILHIVIPCPPARGVDG